MRRPGSAVEAGRKGVLPAASRRRHSFLSLIPGVGIWLTLLMAACGEKIPTSSVIRMESLATQVLRASAGDAAAAADRDELITLLEQARRLEEEQGQRFWWQRDPRARMVAWEDVQRATVATMNEYRARRLADRETWVLAAPQAAERLRRATAEGPATGAVRQHTQLLLEATSQLRMARRLADDSRYAEALVQLARCESSLDTLATHRDSIYARFYRVEERRIWSRMIERGLAEAAQRGEPLVLVEKLARRLWVLERGHPKMAWSVELGTRGLQRKIHAGDRATPEGVYYVSAKKAGTQTRYHKALLLDYPNAEDYARLATAQRKGLLAADLSPGNLIEIHGSGGRGRDWTDGCIALTDREMDTLFEITSVGTPVVIVGVADSPSLGGSDLAGR